jgi:hypothetical protein
MERNGNVDSIISNHANGNEQQKSWGTGLLALSM